MIFVTLGTHGQPFGRALSLVAELAAREKVVVQHGATPADPAIAGVEWEDYLDWPDLVARVRSADAVVCHAGVGSTITALRCGKTPILLPRVAAHGEHVDDHQLQLADRFEQAGWVLVCRDDRSISALVDRARGMPAATLGAGDQQLATAVARAAGIRWTGEHAHGG